MGKEEDGDSSSVGSDRALFSCGPQADLVASAWFGSDVNGNGCDPHGVLFFPLGHWGNDCAASKTLFSPTRMSTNSGLDRIQVLFQNDALLDWFSIVFVKGALLASVVDSASTQRFNLPN